MTERLTTSWGLASDADIGAEYRLFTIPNGGQSRRVVITGAEFVPVAPGVGVAVGIVGDGDGGIKIGVGVGARVGVVVGRGVLVGVGPAVGARVGEIERVGVRVGDGHMVGATTDVPMRTGMEVVIDCPSSTALTQISPTPEFPDKINRASLVSEVFGIRLPMDPVELIPQEYSTPLLTEFPRESKASADKL